MEKETLGGRASEVSSLRPGSQTRPPRGESLALRGPQAMRLRHKDPGVRVTNVGISGVRFSPESSPVLCSWHRDPQDLNLSVAAPGGWELRHGATRARVLGTENLGLRISSRMPPGLASQTRGPLGSGLTHGFPGLRSQSRGPQGLGLRERTAEAGPQVWGPLVGS